MPKPLKQTIESRPDDADPGEQLPGSGLPPVAPAIDPVDAWASQQVEAHRKSLVLGGSLTDLDPELVSKIRAGLTFDQAVEAISNQRRHDAALAGETKPAKDAE